METSLLIIKDPNMLELYGGRPHDRMDLLDANCSIGKQRLVCVNKGCSSSSSSFSFFLWEECEWKSKVGERTLAVTLAMVAA